MAETVRPTIDDLLTSRVQRAGPARLGDPRTSAEHIALAAGFPDPASLPRNDVLEATRIILEREGEWALQYGASRGHRDLVQQLLIKLKRDQGIEASTENLLITYGASQGLFLICEALIDVGDVILSEQPTWSGAVRAFQRSGADVVPIGIDQDGTDVEQLERELEKLAAEGRQPKLFYTIPTYQNPTGVTTTLERRQKIAQLAKQYHLPVIEDDPYGDIRFSGDRLPTIYALDDAGLVFYLGTFSKIMAAGMRLGWVVADPKMIGVLAGLKAEGGTSAFTGAVAAEFCASGTLVEHVAELSKLYHTRRDSMLAALEQSMPDGASWTHPTGGFFIWLTLPESVDARELSEAARERGVEFLPGPACHYSGGEHTLRLSYSFADDDQIAEGIGILGELVTERATK